MTHYERIMRAMEGKEVDRVPVWPFVMAFAAKYAEIPYGKFASDFRCMAQALIRCAEAFDYDAITVDSDAFREASAFGAALEFPEDDLPRMARYAIEDHKAPSKAPDVERCKRLVDKIEAVRRIKEHVGMQMPVCGWIEAPLQCAGTLYNLNDFMADLYDAPEFICDLLELTTQLGIHFAVEQVRAGADIIGIGDAMASLMSPKLYEEYCYPHTKRLISEIRSRVDVKLKYHVCGNATHLLPYVEPLGFDVLTIDYLVDAKQAFQEVGKVCIKGNIDPVNILMMGSPADVDDAADALLALREKRFILSPGCEVPKNTPERQLHALVHSVRRG